MQHVSKWASAAKVALALVLAIGFVPIVPTTAYATANEKGGGSSETVTKEGTNSVSNKNQGNELTGTESAAETEGLAGHKDTAGGLIVMARVMLLMLVMLVREAVVLTMVASVIAVPVIMVSTVAVLVILALLALRVALQTTVKENLQKPVLQINLLLTH